MKILICALAVLFGACHSGPPAPALTTAERAEAVQTVASLQSAHALTRHDCGAHEAMVTPEAWQTLTAEAKRGVTLALSMVCANVGQTDIASMNVVDSQSGKRLAHVGPLGYVVD